MIKMLSYGTLRKGDYNFKRLISYFGEDSINKIDILEIPYFKMYNLGFYPAVIATSDKNDIITTEVLELQKDVSEYIKEMELGAGYREININTIKYGLCKIYIFTSDMIKENYKLIESGNWFNK